jgi:hypothetical protein
VLSIEQSVSDTPVPSGVAPYSISAGKRVLLVAVGTPKTVPVTVRSRTGAMLPLTNPLNRTRVVVSQPDRVQVASDGTGQLTITALRPGAASVTVTYQRKVAAGGFVDVHQSGRPVSTVITVVGRPAHG